MSDEAGQELAKFFAEIGAVTQAAQNALAGTAEERTATDDAGLVSVTAAGTQRRVTRVVVTANWADKADHNRLATAVLEATAKAQLGPLADAFQAIGEQIDASETGTDAGSPSQPQVPPEAPEAGTSQRGGDAGDAGDAGDTGNAGNAADAEQAHRAEEELAAALPPPPQDITNVDPSKLADMLGTVEEALDVVARQTQSPHSAEATATGPATTPDQPEKSHGTDTTATAMQPAPAEAIGRSAGGKVEVSLAGGTVHHVHIDEKWSATVSRQKLSESLVVAFEEAFEEWSDTSQDRQAGQSDSSDAKTDLSAHQAQLQAVLDRLGFGIDSDASTHREDR